MVRALTLVSVLVIGVLVMLGCSNSAPLEFPTAPVTAREADMDGHMLWGYYTLAIDPTVPSVELIPERQAEKHWNVKPFVTPPKCPDCITITPKGPYQDKVLPLSVSLYNPEPLTGYDVRGILISNDEGLTLNNPDDYTTLFDDGPPIELNPFKAFAKTAENRAFASHEEYAQDFNLYLSKFGKINLVNFAVDASWPGRAKEPYEVSMATTIGFLDSYGFEEMSFYIKVLSAGEDIDEVLLDFSSLGFTSEVAMNPVPSSTTWTATISNEHLMPEGQYECWCRASTSSSGLYLYMKFIVTVVVGTAPVSFADDVQPIFNSFCVTCHGPIAPPEELDLSAGNSYSNLVNVDSHESSVKRVTPGDPFMSYLAGKIKGQHLMLPYGGSGDQMPKGGAPLSGMDISTIESWIGQGALNN
jgi:hypothetical protein